MNTKTEAIREGKRLLRLLKGEGWKLRVHENLGWHYAATNELHALEVYPCSTDGWFCLPIPSYSGLCDIKTCYSDPNAAVRGTMRSVAEEVAEYTEIGRRVSSIYQS
jgi:hypothetical protein